MTTIFNHNLVKGKKTTMLHLWKAQTDLAPGVEAGITALKVTHLQCGCVVLQHLLLYVGTMHILDWQ